MKRALILLIVVCLQFVALAQSRLQFRTINNIGLLTGQSQTDMQLQSINGVAFKTFSAGFGIGIDNYSFKTIPVFLDVRKNIFDKLQTPFLYLDLGTNFPEDKHTETTWESSDFKQGIYYDAGIGYSWKLKGKLALNFAAGYSQKKVNETRRSKWFFDDVWPDRYQYTFNRLSLKAGLSF